MRRPLVFAGIAVVGLLVLIGAVLLVLRSQRTVVGGVAPTAPQPTRVTASSPAALTPDRPSPTAPAPTRQVPPTAAPAAAAPTATPALTAAPFTPLRYDDFSQLQSGWAPLFADGQGNVNGYSAEGYAFDAVDPGQLLYDVLPNVGFVPTRYAVEIRSVEGDGRFGLMLDVQGDFSTHNSLSYTAVTLATDGAVAMLAKAPGELEPRVLQQGFLVTPPGPSRPLLLVIERGPAELAVLVDGVEVLRGPSLAGGGGDVGLLVQAYGPLRAQFDNLLLSAAAPGSGQPCAGLRQLFAPSGSADAITGEDVGVAWRRLTQLGYAAGEPSESFGPDLSAAVAAFQRNAGLPTSGVVDQDTWCVLLSEAATRANGQSERAHRLARYRPVTLERDVEVSVPLLMSVRGAERLWQIALALPGKDTLRYLDTGGDAFDPTWSPRTGLLAFTSLRSSRERGAIWILDTTTGELWEASPPMLDSQFPVWSPDGGSLLFTAEPLNGDDKTARNYRYDVTTRVSEQWSEEHAGWSDWASDGAIVFTRWTGRSFDIFVANPDGSGAVNLTNTDDANEDIPAWSPDGSTVAFVRNPKAAPDDRQIYVIGRDGGEPRQLTSLPGPNSNPTWLTATTLAFANQPSDEVRQPYLLDLSGEWRRLSANEDRIWFMGRFDIE